MRGRFCARTDARGARQSGQSRTTIVSHRATSAQTLRIQAARRTRVSGRIHAAGCHNIGTTAKLDARPRDSQPADPVREHVTGEDRERVRAQEDRDREHVAAADRLVGDPRAVGRRRVRWRAILHRDPPSTPAVREPDTFRFADEEGFEVRCLPLGHPPVTFPTYQACL
jgi:hypothetical protein